MRSFANLFLLMFLADGCFSLMDELVPLISPLESFTPFRTLLSGTVIVMAAAVYLCLGIDQRLPKRILIPQIAFVYLATFSIWFFPPLAGVRIYGFLAAVAQVAFGFLPLRYLRQDGVPCLTMPTEMFAKPFFRLRNSLIFGAANLLLSPVALIILALFVANLYMTEYTAGFMRLDPGGLRMTERVYRLGKRTIRLPAMIHLGNKEYYDGLASSIDGRRTIVLAEGVSDDEQLLSGSIDYGKMAGYLGLISQKEMHFPGRLIEPEEFELPVSRSRSGGAGKPEETDILRADVDVSDFRPPTLLLLNAVGKELRDSTSFGSGFLALNSWGEKNITPEMYEIIVDDILHRRNAAVLGYLDKALDRYDTVVIPWGALHMKEIEAEVLKRGFTLQEERERVSIDFRRIISGLLLLS